MTGDTEASRMSDTLSVAEEDVGRVVEFSKSGQECRGFTEGEQAGSIGECHPALGHLGFDDTLGMEIPKDSCRQTVSAVHGKRGIQAGHESE
jgi:hypothetical protein